jgi:hypothetical protein
MDFVTVLGDPDRVCGFVQALSNSGKEIFVVRKTQFNATYIVGYSDGAGASSFILMQSGDYLLLQSGDKIIL